MDEALTTYFDSIPAKRRADADTLVALMRRATGEEPALHGSIVGFGTYHYKYASGREGDSVAAGFAVRKTAFTIYLQDGVAAYDGELARLGAHTTGVGCLYLKSLDGIDLEVLEDVVRRSHETLTAGVFGQRAAEGG